MLIDRNQYWLQAVIYFNDILLNFKYIYRLIFFGQKIKLVFILLKIYGDLLNFRRIFFFFEYLLKSCIFFFVYYDGEANVWQYFLTPLFDTCI